MRVMAGRPLDQIPGAAGNPLTRNAALAACRWTAADGRSADVFAGAGPAPCSGSPVLERFAPVLAHRLAAGAGQADRAAATPVR
jgi:hypothetical protein